MAWECFRWIFLKGWGEGKNWPQRKWHFLIIHSNLRGLLRNRSLRWWHFSKFMRWRSLSERHCCRVRQRCSCSRRSNYTSWWLPILLHSLSQGFRMSNRDFSQRDRLKPLWTSNKSGCCRGILSDFGLLDWVSRWGEGAGSHVGYDIDWVSWVRFILVVELCLVWLSLWH